MHTNSLLSAMILSFALISGNAHAMGDEDFVGPFASWANVQTEFGVKADGVTDNSSAIQAALDKLGSTLATLYFPAGTYRITRPLYLTARIYVNIVGADPSKTKILWDGPSSKSAMLYLNGLAYSRIDRLTFDGKGLAGVAIDQSWKGAGNYFDTGNQYADDTFENVDIGFRCGNLGYGCAETTMLRDRFIHNRVAGIGMKNFNALDMFIWDSLFKDNAVGVTNSPGAGNFHIYESIFENSTSSDIVIGNTGTFNFRDNFSIGSAQFIVAGGTNNPANITIERNTILDTRNAASISVRNLGPVVLLDNIIRSSADAGTGPVVVAAGFLRTDLFSMGNTFTVAHPLFASGHNHSVDDRTVDRDSVQSKIPTLPNTPANNHLRVFEVKPGSTSAQIQEVIDRAAASGGKGAVVHIPAGSYSIIATIHIPGREQIELVGDGYNSHLVWNGRRGERVLRVEGPSHAILREFSVNGASHSADGIEVNGADQPGSRVFMKSPFLRSSYTNLFVNGLDYADLELHDFEHNGAQNRGKNAISVKVTGGPLASSGHWRGGITDIFAGASSGNNISYGISNNAHVAVRDIWYDAGGGNDRQIAVVSGESRFAYIGSTAYQTDCRSDPAIDLRNFDGIAALLNLRISCDIKIRLDSGAQISAIGIVSDQPKFFDAASRSVGIEFLNCQTKASPDPDTASREIPEESAVNQKVLTATLHQIRAGRASRLFPLPSDTTDLRLYRVFVEYSNTGILVTGLPIADGH